LALFACLGGAVSFLAWVLDIPVLASWTLSRIHVQPNAGLCAFATGLALFLQVRGHRVLPLLLAGAAALTGALTLVEHLGRMDLGIDRVLLFNREWGAPATVARGRMGFPSSVAWLSAGMAIYARGLGPAGRRYVAPLGLLLVILSLLSSVGYLFGADQLTGLPRLTAIAFLTALFILAVGLALIASVPEHEPASLLLEDSGAGQLARRALPFVVLFPILLGYLRVRGQDRGLYDTAMGTAMLVILLIVLISGVLWWGADTVSARERALETANRSREEEAEAFRAIEARAAQTLETISDGFVSLDGEWRYTYVNRRAEEIFGKSREDLLGKSAWDLFPEMVGSPVYHSMRRAAAEGVPAEVEDHNPVMDRWFSSKIHPDPGGGVGVFFSDITLRKQSEAVVRESEALFRTMGEAVPNFLWMTDSNGAPIYQNPAWRTYVGMTADEPATGEWGLMPHPDDLPRLRERWSFALARGEAFRVEARMRRHDGEYRWFSGRTVPLKDEEGAIVKWVGTLTDIHDLKTAEAALRENDRRKDEFLATLAHELRNPRAPIRNALYLLDRVDSEEARASAREIIDRQVRHLVRLVDDLLDVSRISRGKLELRLERISAQALVEQALEASRPHIEAAGHTLCLDLPEEPIDVNADPVRMAQVLLNLLNNACKYTPKGGNIWLTLASEGDRCVFRVRDSGIGSAPEVLPDVFQMFSQVSGASPESLGGLGIGLALVHGLVERHGGTVEALSEGKGHGSEFIIRVPLAGGVESHAGAEDSTAAAVRTAPTRRILVVDDNRDNADSLAELLRMLENEVETAYDGEEALTAAERFRPEVILLDLGMPKLDGIAVCRRLRRLPWGKDVLVIAQSGWGTASDRQLTQQAGFDAHLVKPIDHDALYELLASGRAR
jgi:PAS domain S-box-containing protein